MIELEHIYEIIFKYAYAKYNIFLKNLVINYIGELVTKSVEYR